MRDSIILLLYKMKRWVKENPYKCFKIACAILFLSILGIQLYFTAR
ncbi:MAG: hypothetical protein FWH28_08965 [Clostridiales bacterium]|nr:hypothetical protein [Clostridiales bacterium]